MLQSSETQGELKKNSSAEKRVSYIEKLAKGVLLTIQEAVLYENFGSYRFFSFC